MCACSVGCQGYVESSEQNLGDPCFHAREAPQKRLSKKSAPINWTCVRTGDSDGSTTIRPWRSATWRRCKCYWRRGGWAPCRALPGPRMHTSTARSRASPRAPCAGAGTRTTPRRWCSTATCETPTLAPTPVPARTSTATAPTVPQPRSHWHGHCARRPQSPNPAGHQAQ